jgi:hypothetical protein
VTDAEMRQWHAEARPVADEHSCVICGSEVWTWVYPLTSSIRGPVTCGLFWCVCEGCHHVIEAADEVAVATRHGPDDDDEPYPFMSVQWPLFNASRIGEPLRRETAHDPARLHGQS